MRSARDLVRPCRACGYVFAAAKDQCPSCKTWYREPPKGSAVQGDGTKKFSEGRDAPVDRIETGIVDYLLSDDGQGRGGFVRTGVYLIGGSPGAGKSTLTLQWLERVALRTEREGLYIGLEETEDETIGRARRLQLDLTCMRIYPMGCDANIFEIIEKYNPSMIVVDSIGKLAGGDPAKEIEVCKTLKKDVAAPRRTPIIVIAHVTKDMAIAGFQDLIHEVDVAMTFFPIRERKGPRDEPPRDLETDKNRYAPTGLARFDMTPMGLVEIPIPGAPGEPGESGEEGESEESNS